MTEENKLLCTECKKDKTYSYKEYFCSRKCYNKWLYEGYSTDDFILEIEYLQLSLDNTSKNLSELRKIYEPFAKESAKKYLNDKGFDWVKDNKIESIKYVRYITSFGLREAKDFVEKFIETEGNK